MAFQYQYKPATANGSLMSNNGSWNEPSGIGPALGAMGSAQAQAVGNANAARYSGQGQGEAGRFGAIGMTAGAMAQDNANRYGAYAAAEGNRQTAMANEAAARASSAAMAEVGRQTALGNLGSSALGAYGGVANQALQAWTQNQSAYNNALAAMQGSSQNALSQYGASRNAGLGQLGNAYSSAGTGLGAASAVGDLSAQFGGDFGGGGAGGMDAYGPGGTIASGSYGSSPGGGGFSGSVNRSSTNSAVPGVAEATFGGLGSVGDMLMSGDITGQLANDAQAGLDSLNNQHYSSRMMPSQMQNQSFGDLLTMGQQYINPVSMGMDQFYANAASGSPDYAGGMNQFYGAMADTQPDYTGVLGMLNTPTKMGSAPTATSMFGGAMVNPNMLAAPDSGTQWDRRLKQDMSKMNYEAARKGMEQSPDNIGNAWKTYLNPIKG